MSSTDHMGGSRSNSSNSIFNQDTTPKPPIETGRVTSRATGVYGLDNEFLKRMCNWRPKAFDVLDPDDLLAERITLGTPGISPASSADSPRAPAIPTFEQFRKATESLWVRAQDLLPKQGRGRRTERRSEKKEGKSPDGRGEGRGDSSAFGRDRDSRKEREGGLDGSYIEVRSPRSPTMPMQTGSTDDDEDVLVGYSGDGGDEGEGDDTSYTVALDTSNNNSSNGWGASRGRVSSNPMPPILTFTSPAAGGSDDMDGDLGLGMSPPVNHRPMIISSDDCIVTNLSLNSARKGTGSQRNNEDSGISSAGSGSGSKDNENSKEKERRKGDKVGAIEIDHESDPSQPSVWRDGKGIGSVDLSSERHMFPRTDSTNNTLFVPPKTPASNQQGKTEVDQRK
jgi:hypothetical protein